MRIALIGAGSWGTALGRLLGGREHEVALWTRDLEHARALATERENRRYLPGLPLPQGVTPTADLGAALQGAALAVIALPSEAVRGAMRLLAPQLEARTTVVSAVKGLEIGSCARMSEVIAQELSPGQRIAVLSGPSFARELAQGVLTAVVVACRDERVAREIQASFSTDAFRVYTSTDVVGVEVGGALKNIIAVAAGCADALGAGHNSRAALMTRGLAEMARLAQRLGGNPLTLAGLAGMGDLVLTCTGDLSRNRRLGLALGQGRPLAEILAELGQVAEAVPTVRSAFDLGRRLEVEMPITEQIYRVVHEGKPPAQAVRDLMKRDLKPELT